MTKKEVSHIVVSFAHIVMTSKMFLSRCFCLWGKNTNFHVWNMDCIWSNKENRNRVCWLISGQKPILNVIFDYFNAFGFTCFNFLLRHMQTTLLRIRWFICFSSHERRLMSIHRKNGNSVFVSIFSQIVFKWFTNELGNFSFVMWAEADARKIFTKQ